MQHQAKRANRFLRGSRKQTGNEPPPQAENSQTQTSGGKKRDMRHGGTVANALPDGESIQRKVETLRRLKSPAGTGPSDGKRVRSGPGCGAPGHDALCLPRQTRIFAGGNSASGYLVPIATSPLPPRPPLRCFCPTVQPRPYPLAAMGLNQPGQVTFWLLREAVDRNFPTHNP